MHERTTRIIVAGLSRFMDELPVVIMGSIALGLIGLGMAESAKSHNFDGLIHDGVLGIITGFFGYMKGRSDGSRPPSSPPPAAE